MVRKNGKLIFNAGFGNTDKVGEKKQNEKLLKEDHKILYFSEYSSPESECKYYIPNGKYWEDRKNGKLKENANSSILDLTGY